ncbi:hypothetical protein BDP27DRAFT_1333694 [Rhodocollybia butyracea]|uniref:Uncharacterized protein n=1 Tax=Rhodocollybia butyracea TaxID=206335 RepID=A0A9P5PJC7_9AGAR|nr:hypothetical protein BDP27DRAFT_1333694 [Rhodocollybia butyracea]
MVRTTMSQRYSLEATPALGAHSRSTSSVNFQDEGDTEYSGATMDREGSRRLSQTDRQRDVEEKIYHLNALLMSLENDSSSDHKFQRDHVEARIARLEDLRASNWARGLTNEPPAGL